MKRNQAIDTATGQSLRIRMILLLAAVSVSLLSVTLIALLLLTQMNITSLQELVFGGPRNFSLRPAFALLTVPAVIGTAAVAWLAYSITTSVSRFLAASGRFVKAMAEGRFDPPDIAATTPLYLSLNNLSESLRERSSRIGAVRDHLVSIDNKLERTTRHLAKSDRDLETAASRVAAYIDNSGISSGALSRGIDLLEEATSSTGRMVRDLDANIRGVTSHSGRLEKSCNEVGPSVTEMVAAMGALCSGILNLQQLSNETASSAARMMPSIKKIEKTAQDASTISEQLKSDAEAGRQATEETVKGMRFIRDASRLTSEAIKSLWQRVDDVGAILSVIEEVAEQTDLLALNATIIAAQAGDQGRGFAVIADEIRELAERTSSSTREISAVIGGVREDTRRAVDEIHRVETSIAAGERLSHLADGALRKIVAGILQADSELSRVESATVEQAQLSRSIDESVQGMAGMVRRIATLSTEQTRAGTLLVTAVERLQGHANHVRQSAAVQADTGAMLARTAAEALDAIGEIRSVGDSRAVADETAVSALAALLESLAGRRGSITSLEAAGNALKKELILLEGEISGPSAQVPPSDAPTATDKPA